jgi:hypothetical protein
MGVISLFLATSSSVHQSRQGSPLLGITQAHNSSTSVDEWELKGKLQLDFGVSLRRLCLVSRYAIVYIAVPSTLSVLDLRTAVAVNGNPDPLSLRAGQM